MISDLCKIFAISTLIAISACRSNGTEESSQNLTKIHYPNFEELFLEEYARPFKSGDIDSWIKLFADDAVALHNRREADVGKDAIEAFGRIVSQYFEVQEFDTTLEDVHTSGEWAFTRGTFISKLVSRDNGKAAPWGREKGKFFLLWERQDDGSWKVIVDMGNSIGPADGNTPITLQEKNKALVARVINEVLNKENYALIDELLSDNLVEHDPNQEKRADAKESFKAAVQAFKSAFPDGQTIIESQVAEGDIVVTRWRMTGTHKGIFMGIEATNKKIEMTGMFYDRVLDGQLHETWSNWDLFGLMRQLQ